MCGNSKIIVAGGDVVARAIIIAVVVCLCLRVSPGIIPKSWCRYTVPSGLTVIQWVTDFSERVKQLQAISKKVSAGGSKVLKVREKGTFLTRI